MTITPSAHLTLTTIEDWPQVKRHMILNGMESITLTIEQFDHLAESLNITARLEEAVEEMRSTIAEIHHLTTT